MEAQFKRLLSHAKDDVKILNSITGGVSKRKTLGSASHKRKRMGGGHENGWWHPPQTYGGRRLKPNENIHDVYQKEFAKWKGKPEDFTDYFENHVG